MEHVAEVSGADPVEVRRLNFLKAYPLASTPQIHPSAAGKVTNSSSSQEVYAVQCYCSSYLPAYPMSHLMTSSLQAL